MQKNASSSHVSLRFPTTIIQIFGIHLVLCIFHFTLMSKFVLFSRTAHHSATKLYDIGINCFWWLYVCVYVFFISSFGSVNWILGKFQTFILFRVPHICWNRCCRRRLRRRRCYCHHHHRQSRPYYLLCLLLFQYFFCCCSRSHNESHLQPIIATGSQFFAVMLNICESGGPEPPHHHHVRSPLVATIYILLVTSLLALVWKLNSTI